MSGEVSFSIQRAQGVGPVEPRDLIPELEVLEDVLHRGREPVEVVLEVGPELLPAGPRPQVVQGELRRVVERLLGRLPQGHLLVGDPQLVQPFLHVQDGLLGGFEHRVKPPQHGHGKDDVAVLAAHVDIAEHVVRDHPDVVRDPAQIAVCHVLVSSSLGFASQGRNRDALPVIVRRVLRTGQLRLARPCRRAV